MLFVPNYHWKFSIYTPLGDIEIIEIGKRYIESILIQKLSEGKDYVSFSKLYLLFRLECCYSYEDALRMGLISLPTENIVDDSFEMSIFCGGDVENGEISTAAGRRLSSNMTAGSVNESMENPLHAKSAFETDSEKDVVYTTNAIYRGKLNEITENPLLKNADTVDRGDSIVRVSYSNIYDPSDGAFKTDFVSANALVAGEIMTSDILEQYNNLTEEDKASLHIVLKSELHLNDAEITHITANNNHNDSGLSGTWRKATNMFRKKAPVSSLESLELLKSRIIKEIKRKELKNTGLRGSFVNTFRFFEEKEQITNSKPTLDSIAIRAKGIHMDHNDHTKHED